MSDLAADKLRVEILPRDRCIGVSLYERITRGRRRPKVENIAEDVLVAAGLVFDDWIDRLAASLEADGRDQASASGLATLIVASLEGAIVLCRAQRSITAFDQICEQLDRLLLHSAKP
jgi:hypothetical protein